eukprot:COSAG02_NODE_2387_length_8986_cov_12.395184_10_plen_292_part_00
MSSLGRRLNAVPRAGALLLLFATNARAQWGYTLLQTSPCSTNAATPCQPGEYRSYTVDIMTEVFAEGDCLPCPAGTFSIDGATWDACEAGYCTECPAGKYVDTEGATSCIACPAGKNQEAGAFLDETNIRDSYQTNSVWRGIARTSGAFPCEECPAGRRSDAGAVLANNAVCNNANDMGTMSNALCALTGPEDTASAACARGQAECCEKSSGCSTCLDNGSPWRDPNQEGGRGGNPGEGADEANRQNPCLYSYAETPCEIDLNSEGKAASVAGSPRAGVAFVLGALLAALA